MAENSTKGQPIRCKAAVAREPGKPLVIEEVMVAPPREYELRIKIICTSLCHSDITFWKLKDPPACFPRILGHEAVGRCGGRRFELKSLTPGATCRLSSILRFWWTLSDTLGKVVEQESDLNPSLASMMTWTHFGIVESVGKNVVDIVEGDMVVPVFLADCGDCNDCKSSKSNLCSKMPFNVSPWMPREESSRFMDLKGETLFHFLFVSSFSQYTVVDIAHVTKIDSSLPPNRACLLSCGVSTGIGAAWRAANITPGSTVAIFGLGAIGLAVAEGARFCGAAKIIAVDVNPEKFEIGKKFGITDFVNPNDTGDKSIGEVINEMTDGGADYCFECVGIASLVQEAYSCCRKGWGKTIVLGVDQPDSKLSLSSIDVLCSGKTLVGSLYGGLKHKSDVPILAKLYMNKEIQLDGFVTHEMKFDEINKAFELLVQGKCLRCVLWMD